MSLVEGSAAMSCALGFFLLSKDCSRFSQFGSVRQHHWWMPMDLTFDAAPTVSCMVWFARRDFSDISAHQQELHLNSILAKHRSGSLRGTSISKGTKRARLQMLQCVNVPSSATTLTKHHCAICIEANVIKSAQCLFNQETLFADQCCT